MPPPEPISETALPCVRSVSPLQPLRWLRAGWLDLRRIGWPSLVHGLLLAVGGQVIVTVALVVWYLLPGAISGFLLIGPILATGLYELSRRRELGEQPHWDHVVAAWRCGACHLVWLGLALALVATLWVLISAVLVALFVQDSITGFDDFVRHVVLSEGSHLFPVWMTLGGVVASLVFAASVVSAPLLLDRDVSLLTAVQTSLRAVAENPIALALWAVMIMLATVIGLATLMLGFIVIIPIFGHATWHAYRDLVDASLLPRRS